MKLPNNIKKMVGGGRKLITPGRQKILVLVFNFQGHAYLEKKIPVKLFKHCKCK